MAALAVAGAECLARAADVAARDGIPVTTRVVNRNQLVATIPANLLGRAGAFKLTVKNPAPLATPEETKKFVDGEHKRWGEVIKKANITMN